MSDHSVHWSPLATATPFSRRRGRHSTQILPTTIGDERVIHRWQRPDGAAAVATDIALHYRTTAVAWRRVMWVDVLAVGFSSHADRLQLRCRTVDGHASTVQLAADATLGALAAERVTHAHILRRRVELTPGIFGIAELLRTADSAGSRWRIQPENQVYADDPAIRQACARVMSELRALTGC